MSTLLILVILFKILFNISPYTVTRYSSVEAFRLLLEPLASKIFYLNLRRGDTLVKFFWLKIW